MSDEANGNGDSNGNGNGNGNGNEKVQFRKKDGVEKDGYICFPVATTPEEVEEEQEQEEVEEREEPRAVRNQLGTCLDDPRFQQTNKTKWCNRMYVDYHRCKLLLGDNCNMCDYFYNCYNSICPNGWVERWDEQVKNGNFPFDFSREQNTPQPPPCP